MSKLAIKGGTPVAPGGLKIHWPIYGELEEKHLLETLHSGRWCSMGRGDSMVAKAEAQFAEFIGTKYATCVPTGTDALTLALKTLGIGAGDEVIVPAVTFIASASAVVLANAIPVFVDIEPETYQISPDAVEVAITGKTRAIEVVHYGGYPADMDRIMEIARRHNLFVVEDACEAHGSEWRGKKVGSIGNIGCFSFQMGKPLTCGEGGALTYSDDALAPSCYAQQQFGRTKDGHKYMHYILAGNHRMSEFCGAILLGQMARIREQTEARWANGEYLAQELEKIGGIRALKRDPRITKRGYYFYLLRYDAKQWKNVHRDRFMEALEAEGIGAHTAHNEPLYHLPAFQNLKHGCPLTCSEHGREIDYTQVHCPVADRVYESEIVSLGKDFLANRALVDQTLEAIQKIKNNVDELL